MPRNIRLQYRNFRQIYKGEPGYNPTRRRYIDESSGEIITKYEFQKRASRIPSEEFRQHLREQVASGRPQKVETGEQRFIGGAEGRVVYHGYTPYDRTENIYKSNLNQYYTQQYYNAIENGAKPMTRSEAENSADFQRAMELLNAGDRSKGGGVAYALFLLGYLDEEDWFDFDPGES